MGNFGDKMQLLGQLLTHMCAGKLVSGKLGEWERDSCFLALRESSSIISWSARRVMVANFLCLRYWQCLFSNFLEGCLAKLVGMRDWSKVMVIKK